MISVRQFISNWMAAIGPIDKNLVIYILSVGAKWLPQFIKGEILHRNNFDEEEISGLSYHSDALIVRPREEAPIRAIQPQKDIEAGAKEEGLRRLLKTWGVEPKTVLFVDVQPFDFNAEAETIVWCRGSDKNLMKWAMEADLVIGLKLNGAKPSVGADELELLGECVMMERLSQMKV